MYIYKLDPIGWKFINYHINMCSISFYACVAIIIMTNRIFVETQDPRWALFVLLTIHKHYIVTIVGLRDSAQNKLWSTVGWFVKCYGLRISGAQLLQLRDIIWEKTNNKSNNIEIEKNNHVYDVGLGQIMTICSRKVTYAHTNIIC